MTARQLAIYQSAMIERDAFELYRRIRLPNPEEIGL
jgi:hypothetical protein